MTDTVESIMARVDEYAERREHRGEDRTEQERAALRAAVERVIRERDDLALEIHEERANSGRVHEVLSRAEAERDELLDRHAKALHMLVDVTAERDELKSRLAVENAESMRQYNEMGLRIDLERAETERDALRALLVKALPFVVSAQTFDGHTTETPSGLLARIDAAMKEKP